jgi:hypothetical protein
MTHSVLECDKCGGAVVFAMTQWEFHWDTEKVQLVEIHRCVKCDRIFARKRPPQEIGRLA